MKHCKAARHRRRCTLFAAGGLSLLLGLAACTPDSRPDSIAAEAAKPIHRTDRFQAVAATGDHLVAVGAFGVVATSADRGGHWSRIALPGAPALIDVAACGDGSLAALDFNGSVWRTEGAAANSWTATKVPATDALLAMHFADARHGAVVGLAGAVLESGDGGASWSRSKAPTEAPLYGVRAQASGRLVAIGAGGTALSRDDGRWSVLDGAPKTDLRGIVATPSAEASLDSPDVDRLAVEPDRTVLARKGR